MNTINSVNRSNAYRIYIRSNEHPRTINTPRNGRTYYTVIEVFGKADYLATLEKLVNNGETVTEVRFGWGGAVVNHYADLYRMGIR